jgi:cytochrome c
MTSPKKITKTRIRSGFLISVLIIGYPGYAQRPGDRQFPDTMNPAYEMVKLLPLGFKPQVTGMDSLQDGTLVISTREDSPTTYAPLTSGKIYLVSGTGKYSPINVSYKAIAEGLFEPMGVVVVHDTIYTVTRRELIEFADVNHDGIYESKKTVCTGWPYGGYNPSTGKFENAAADDIFEWSFGLVFKDGSFYANLSSHSTTDVGQSTDRGSVIRMQRNNTFEIINGGIRRSNGIGLGPNNDIFVTDNQGEWVPTNRLIHSQAGKWYGYHNGPDYNKTQNFSLGKTAIWMEWYPVARSPSQPSLLIQGPYRGQMITGDCTDPNIRRMFLEKVSDEYQGAIFHFAAMNKAPANRFLMRPNGDVLVGGLGSFTQGHGDWNWGGGVLYDLQLLRPTGNIPFDFLAVRAVQGGFDLEFTKPVGVGAENVGNYEIRTWGYISERRYDSPKQNEYQISPTSVKLSGNRKRVFLAMNNLKAGNVVYIRLRESIQSEENEKPWVTEAWYTLNNFGTALPLLPVTEPWIPTVIKANANTLILKAVLRFEPRNRKLLLNGIKNVSASLIILDIDGHKKFTANVSSGQNEIILPMMPPGIYIVKFVELGFRKNENYLSPLNISQRLSIGIN